MGGNGSAALYWKSIEAKSEFVDLAKVGAAASKEFYVSFADGKFIIRVHASIAWGFGASGSVDLEVNSTNMYHFITFVYTQLRDNDFHFLNFMQEDSFEALCYGLAWVVIKGNPLVLGVTAGIELYDYVSSNFDIWKTWWDDNAQKSELVNKAVQNIKQNKDMIKYLPPEARANILDTLCTEVNGPAALWTFFQGDKHDHAQDDIWNSLNLVRGLNEPQETAILTVLKWVQSKNDLDNILLRMGPKAKGQKLSDLSEIEKGARRWNNVSRIYKVLDGGQKEQFRSWWSLLDADAKRKKKPTDKSEIPRRLPETSKVGPVRQVL